MKINFIFLSPHRFGGSILRSSSHVRATFIAVNHHSNWPIYSLLFGKTFFTDSISEEVCRMKSRSVVLATLAAQGTNSFFERKLGKA